MVSTLWCLFIVNLVYLVEGFEEKGLVEGRGSEYALLINLSILLFLKLGLYKIFVSIAFVIAGIKFFVILALIFTFYQYLPDQEHSPEGAFPVSFTQGLNGYSEKESYNLKAGHSFLDFIYSYFRRQLYNDVAVTLLIVNTFPVEYFFKLQQMRLHMIYAMSTKIFVLKMVYGALLIALLLKAWKFSHWVFKYLTHHEHHHAPWHPPDHDLHHEEFDYHYSPGNHYLKKPYDSDGSFAVFSDKRD